jgi:3-hydroxyacyl-CoA dehydrogenase / 3-hydroxy-2-methylbutyryl-CoA dehydrogenase
MTIQLRNASAFQTTMRQGICICITSKIRQRWLSTATTTHSSSSSSSIDDDDSRCMKNVVALVTGGSSGLGAGAARSLVLSGARVLVADLHHQESAYRQWVQQLESSINVVEPGETWLRSSSDDSIEADQKRGCISFVEMNVTDEKQVDNAFNRIEQQYGVVSPNVIVNCAGIATARRTISSKKGDMTIRVHPIEEFTKTLTVNTIGTFLVSTLAAERMCRQQQQHETSSSSNYCIIHTASIAAYEGQVGQVAYAASKGGVVGMTLPMARDLASYNIRVMTIVSLNNQLTFRDLDFIVDAEI